MNARPHSGDGASLAAAVRADLDEREDWLLTYRFPRDLEMAFGPHTSRRIDDPEAMPAHEKALYATAAVGVAVVALNLILERV